MPALSRKEKQLSQALLDLHDGAMLIEELDGFIAGLLVCPEMIPPSVWLPLVWNAEGSDGPVFDNLAHVNKLMGLVMEHYNRIASTLFERPNAYAPLFAVDERNGHVLWELWIDGFEKAVKLRPEAWQPLVTANTKTAVALGGLMTLTDVARADSRFSDAQVDALTATAHEKIAGWVVDLNAWRLASHTPAPGARVGIDRFVATPASRVGRNDPCTCGSGKKYKKCCGLN